MTLYSGTANNRPANGGARRWPFNKIADEIGVSKPTLINWERDLKESIDNLQAAELEAMYDKYYPSVQEGRVF